MSEAAEFAERFAAYWRAPSVEGLDEILAPDVELVAPLTRATHGLPAGKVVFARLLRLLPDLTAVVHRWGPTEDGVLIEFTLSATVSGKRFSWDAIDRFVLREDGLATVRISYFNSAKLIRTILASPRTWPALIRRLV
jgi:ketosteroid isomerase-like protein